MNKTNHILDLWTILESEDALGINKRLYDSNSQYHIYATYTSMDRYYGIGVSFDNTIKVDISPFLNLKEIRVSQYIDNSFANSSLLLVELISPLHKDTFSLLCENLINSVCDLPSEKEMVTAVINQLEKWRKLFDKTKGEGLSTELQQGLYGELSFLEKILKKKLFMPSIALDFWVGIDAAMRDFQGNEWAVEVKTTSTNNPQKVKINGERQLDDSLLKALFLFHYSVEVSKHNGETLNTKVNKIREMLISDAPAMSLFNDKLITAGYFDEDYKLYEGRCYKVRDEHCFTVKDDFPRIRESELREAVGDVTYYIVLSACDKYRITENILFKTIIAHE